MLRKVTVNRMASAVVPSIVKIAVELKNHSPQLIEFNQKSTLTAIIRNLCQNWNLTDDENYALKFCEPNNRNYVTEKNRNEVKHGIVLRLCHSPTKTAHDILGTIKTGSNLDKTLVLGQLSSLSSDPTFALEFIKEQGLNIIISMVETEQCIGEVLKLIMMSFVKIMDHDAISWDILQPKFISRNIHFINDPSTIPCEVVQCALSTLEHIIHSNSHHSNMIDVPFDSLLNLLQDQQSQITQHNTIALINALFMKGDDQRRHFIAKILNKKTFQAALLDTVGKANIGISHQLYVLQTLTLGLLKNRMTMQLNPKDPDAHEKLMELRRIACDEGIFGNTQHDVYGRSNSIVGIVVQPKKIAFKCELNPARDFIKPPGMLALDCMLYFAQNYRQEYTDIVYENSYRSDSYECPRTNIELVKLLCELLHIGEAPTEQGQEFHAMFFTHDHPFEEFYCICIVVLNRTWKDMRATSEDSAKVFSVVREQIQRSLKERPEKFDDFRTKMNSFTFEKITLLRQQQRLSKGEFEMTASAVVQLKEKITPEIIELIKEQRLGYLVKGTRFFKYSRGAPCKDKFWYARLSPNYKVIHYGDCDENVVPTLDELTNKIQVDEIRQLLVGSECPHMKEMKRKSAMNLGFSITFDKEDNPTFDFVAPDETVFNYWTDGINGLLGCRMVSKQKDEDLNTLLSIDVKLRLLDTEGIDILQEPPPIPDSPEDYDFDFAN